VAIVLAMSVVALAALATTAMMVSQSTWARQVELTADHAQAHYLVEAGLDWARVVLNDDQRTSTVDFLGEPWALQLPAIPVENGNIAGHIEDQQGKFNVNNLLDNGQVNPVQLAHFRHLLVMLDLSPDLADTLTSWINTSNLLTDIAELTLVPGFDDDTRERLRPFVTALPQFTALNVNTTSAEVLSASIDGLTLDEARRIVAQRNRAYFRDFSDFSSQLSPGLHISSENISTSSDFFVASVSVNFGDVHATGSALLARLDANWPTIIWRKYP
jgi:general secretion pathway protein K